MRAKPCSSFALLLLSAPLAAIPMMATFGVPQLTAVSASTALAESAADDVVRQPSPAVVVDHGQPPPSALAHEGAAVTGVSFDTDAPQSSPLQRPTAPLRSQELTSTLSDHETPDDPSIAVTGVPSVVVTDPTWHNAAERLREMGIDDYRLERGHRSDSFLFICQFASGGDDRIVQRFEAEAAEPMVAVQQVITQIDHWRQRTSAVSPRSN